jgi:nucleoid-associated protein YgaU
MFGRGADTAKGAETFEQLKSKYHAALVDADAQHVRWQALQVQDGKLYAKGSAPSEAAKNHVWDAIKQIDPNYSQDLVADISVDPTIAPQSNAASNIGATLGTAAAGAAAGSHASRSYTVVAGDSLSEISRQFYGDPNEYMRIFYANRSILKDPDMIQPGQNLVIPPDDDN